MAKQTVVQSNFNGGEVSPRFLGRFDFEKYPNCLKKCENFVLNTLGGAQFSSGTRYVAEVKDSSARTRLVPFQYNSQQAYLLEIGDAYMRFYTQRAQVIVNASTPIDTYTKLLSHFDGSNAQTTYTAEVGGTISFFGDAQLSTAQQEFGASSLYCNGTGYITLPNSSDWDISTGDFTIDFWFRTTDKTQSQMLFNHATNDATYMNLYWDGSNWQFYDVTSGITITGADTISNNTWYHVALVRNGTGFVIYRGGTSKGTATSASSLGSYTGPISIGGSTYNGTLGLQNPMYGYIDEYRISKGIARWTTSFTPPAYPYGGAADWATSTSYVIGDYVTHSGTVYLCLVAHTSGTFATDLANGKWTAQTALQIVTPWALADVPSIQYSQNADVMYFYHPNYPTQKLTRVSSTSFTIVDAPFIRGPFLDTNTSTTTITPSSATGSTTLTASTGIFQSGHVGSLWRVNAAVVLITGYTSASVVTGTVQAEPNGTSGNIGGTSAYTDWAEGAFSDVRGYPSTGTFHEQRHYVASTTYQTQHVWGTYIGAFDNFKTDANDDSAALGLEIVSEQVNAIRWLNSDVEALQIGTSGGSFSLSSGTQGLTITATNVKAHKDSSQGAYSIMPKRISNFLYYIHKTANKMFEIVYNYLSNRDMTNDMTKLADHILRDGSGAYEMAYQQSPNDRVWVIRNDGQIAILTRNAEEQIMGWSRRIGALDSTTYGKFESIAIIQQDSQDDEVWVIVKRHINGSVVRYVEYFTEEYFTYQWEPVLLDCSLTLDSPYDISGATTANPVVITAAGHTFSNGDQVKIDKVVGMTELNGNSYIVAGVSGSTFSLKTTGNVDVDGSAYSDYLEGGEVRKMVNNVTGADHLEGETVKVQADGQALSGTYTVSSGTLSPALTDKAAVIHIGLPYTGVLQFLKMNTQSTSGTGQTKKKNIYRSDFRVSQSKSFKISQKGVTFNTVSMPSSAGTDIYSGDVNNVRFENSFDENTELTIKQDKAQPLMILAAFFRVDTEETA